MNRLVPLLRAYLLAQGQKLILQHVVGRVSDACEHHVPLGGAATLPRILSQLSWRDQLRFAQCSTAALSAVSAHFGAEHSPMECKAVHLSSILGSRVCRLARHLHIDCSDLSSLNESSINVLREMPLLRFLTFAEMATEDSELLALLTRRPPLDLLQGVRIERCHSLDAQALHSLRCLPHLHTMALVECTLNGEEVLEELPDCKHLETLSLSFTPASGFTSSSLRTIMKIPKLKRLHLHTLLCPPGFLAPIFREMFSSSVFTNKLEALSLCYVSFLSSSGRPLPESEYQRFSEMTALKCLELSWCTPLERILPQVCRLPELHTLLIGDDNVQLIERSLESHLIPARKLQEIRLYGFAGVPHERFDEWAALVDVSSTAMHPQSLRSLGARREQALPRCPELEWAR
jgi:hypothetical protein